MRSCLIVINDNEAIFLRIFLQLIFYSAHNILYLLAKQIEQGLTCYFSALGLLLHTLLCLNYLSDSCIVVLEISRRFTVVQVNQHIRQIRAQLGLSIVKLLLRLIRVLLVRLLLAWLGLGLLGLRRSVCLATLPARILRVDGLALLLCVERFPRKVSVLFLWLLASVLLIFVLFVLLVGVAVVEALFVLVIVVEVLDGAGSHLEVLLVNDLLHGDDSLVRAKRMRFRLKSHLLLIKYLRTLESIFTFWLLRCSPSTFLTNIRVPMLTDYRVRDRKSRRDHVNVNMRLNAALALRRILFASTL